MRSPPSWSTGFSPDQPTTVVCWGGGLNKYQSTAADCLQRPVRRSRSCSIPITDGKDSEEILGSTAYLTPKGRGDKSLPRKPGTAEGAYVVARQDPRDMAKAGWV